MDDAFGNWLAGFIDGEGHFYIACSPRQTNYHCGMKMSLRDDDAEILATIHMATGLGVLGRSDWHHRQKITNGATARWEIGSRPHCLGLIRLLDRYPLRTKKARDYAIWCEAVQAVADAREPPGARRGQKGGRATKDWSRCALLKAQLQAVRVYH
jgi:hypothetical protein